MFVKIKILPRNPNKKPGELKPEIEEIIKKFNGSVKKFEEVPIAFGLISLVVLFEMSENGDTEPIENAIENSEEVSSIELLDIRRAVG